MVISKELIKVPRESALKICQIQEALMLENAAVIVRTFHLPPLFSLTRPLIPTGSIASNWESKNRSSRVEKRSCSYPPSLTISLIVLAGRVGKPTFKIK